MRYIILAALLAGSTLACSTSPDLDSVMQAGGGMGRRGHRDGGFNFDGFHPHPDMAQSCTGDMCNPPPCPTVFKATKSFCYWVGGPDTSDLTKALLISSGGASCTLQSGTYAVGATGTTCTAEFDSMLVTGWGIDSTKAAHLAFAFSAKSSIDSAALTVTMPSGSMKEMIKIDGISGQGNQLSLYSPKGSMFVPGFNLTLGDTATSASLNFDWISVWQ